MGRWYIVLVLGLVKFRACGGKSDQCMFRPPFIGETHALATSLPSVYESVTCAWDQHAGTYWWSAPFKSNAPPNPTYGGDSYAGGGEIGQGWWLTPPTFHMEEESATWTSTSFMAARYISYDSRGVPRYNQTDCCCQYVAGDDRTHEFNLTEFCRAGITGLEPSAIDMCAPFAEESCPPDLAAAYRATWPFPSYSEHYSSCTRPLGTVLPPSPPQENNFNAISEAGLEEAQPGGQKPKRASGAAVAAILALAVVAVVVVGRDRRTVIKQAGGPQEILSEQLLSA